MSTTTNTTTTATQYRDGDRCAHDYWPTACGICPAPAVAYNLQDELQRAGAGEPSTIPCPQWCERAGNHPYDVPSLGSTTRMHGREVPASDDAPTVMVWGYDLLEATHRELDEPEIDAKDSNKADVPMRHVPAFAEAMQEAARLVRDTGAASGDGPLTGEPHDMGMGPEHLLHVRGDEQADVYAWAMDGNVTVAIEHLNQKHRSTSGSLTMAPADAVALARVLLDAADEADATREEHVEAASLDVEAETTSAR